MQILQETRKLLIRQRDRLICLSKWGRSKQCIYYNIVNYILQTKKTFGFWDIFFTEFCVQFPVF